jgi:N-acetyl-1-D-myo-inositol-2-amino-2-deoxy-alpha-D-glucopyranoside deacetylase
MSADLPRGGAQRRLLLVHAHPDDEAIATGATMAKYAAEGAHVALVTCTLGEEGEILVPELSHLGADGEDALGAHRVGELADAMKVLGITDYRFLGGQGRFRDSGMMGTPSNDRPDAFWRADLDEATRELVGVVREVRPQVVITYDENGAYGHPDHIKAHQVAMAAFDKAADPAYEPAAGEPWQASKLYYAVVARSMLQEAIERSRAAGRELFEGVESADDVPFAVDEAEIAAEVDAREFFDAKFAALRAYPTQITATDPLFALEDGAMEQGFAVEHYVLARGERGPGSGPYSWERDLFAGLDL